MFLGSRENNMNCIQTIAIIHKNNKCKIAYRENKSCANGSASPGYASTGKWIAVLSISLSLKPVFK